MSPAQIGKVLGWSRLGVRKILVTNGVPQRDKKYAIVCFKQFGHFVRPKKEKE